MLDVGWQLLAAMYRVYHPLSGRLKATHEIIQVASEQDNLNREVENLLSSLLSAFVFIEDADQLASAPNTLPSLQRTISSLVDQLIDCSLFIATYVRTKTLSDLVSLVHFTNQADLVLQIAFFGRQTKEKG